MPDTQNAQLPSAGWTRATAWRQGSVISADAAVKLGLVKPDEIATAVVVVISHDCDLANDNLDAEPYVEVVIGRRIDAADGNFTAAKSTRILHLNITDVQPPLCIELNATRKAVLSKERLAGFQPSTEFTIKDKNLQTLQAWLAARYRRAAFPDTLVNRLKPVEEAFAKAMKRSTDEIIAVFVDFEPEEDGLDMQEPYSLYLTVVYSTDVTNAEAKAQAVVQRLSDAFNKHFKLEDKWRHIELRGCAALSDTEFTLRDVLQTKQYRLEHLSYRQEPPGPVAEVL